MPCQARRSTPSCPVFVSGALLGKTSPRLDSGSGAGMTTALYPGGRHDARPSPPESNVAAYRPSREGRPLHNRHSRAVGNPGARWGSFPIDAETRLKREQI